MILPLLLTIVALNYSNYSVEDHNKFVFYVKLALLSFPIAKILTQFIYTPAVLFNKGRQGVHDIFSGTYLYLAHEATGVRNAIAMTLALISMLIYFFGKKIFA